MTTREAWEARKVQEKELYSSGPPRKEYSSDMSPGEYIRWLSNGNLDRDFGHNALLTIISLCAILTIPVVFYLFGA